MSRTTFPALALITLALLAPAVSAASQTIPFNKTITTPNNLTITVSGSITIDTTAQTISITVSISVVNNTSGQTLFSNTFTFVHSIPATGGKFLQAIPSTFTNLAADCSLAGCTVLNNPDLHHDGVVDIGDLAAVASSFGKTGPSPADLTGDGVVNIADLSLVASLFGTPVFYG